MWIQPCFLRCINLPPENLNSGTAKTRDRIRGRGLEGRESILKYFNYLKSPDQLPVAPPPTRPLFCTVCRSWRSDRTRRASSGPAPSSSQSLASPREERWSGGRWKSRALQVYIKHREIAKSCPEKSHRSQFEFWVLSLLGFLILLKYVFEL